MMCVICMYVKGLARAKLAKCPGQLIKIICIVHTQIVVAYRFVIELSDLLNIGECTR